MNQDLKTSLIHFSIALIAIWIWVCLSGCAPEYRISQCRHRAVLCALVYGEVYGPERVGIAIGPTASLQWHGQAFLATPQGRRWIENRGYGCEIGDQEPFQPAQDFTVDGFMRYQFGQFEK